MEKRKLAGLFLVSAVMAVLFLLAGALLVPQEKIRVQYVESFKLMQEEGRYPRTYDHSHYSQLDNYTDAIILAESYYMNRSDWRTIFSNSMPVRAESAMEFDEDPVEYFYADSLAEEAPESFVMYSRYWVGLRTVVRFLLLVMNTYQAKRYIAFSLFVLFSGLICSISKHLTTKHAMVFAIAVILVRPEVIASSYQFMTCFLIAFLGMLLVPEMMKRKWMDAFFLELGILTMYFDFYTVPLVTFGLPYLYAYQLRNKTDSDEQYTVRHLLRKLAIWGSGYLGMWFTKMTLATIFTGENSFYYGLGETLYWMNVFGMGVGKMLMHPFEAVGRNLTGLWVDKIGMAIFFCAAIAAFGMEALCRKKKTEKMRIKWSAPVVAALIPLVWFMLSAKPSYVHHWFQYRSVVLTVYGIGIAAFLDQDTKESIH